MRQLYTGIAGVGFASQTKYTSSESPAECLKAQPGGRPQEPKGEPSWDSYQTWSGLRSRANTQANDSGPAMH